MKVAVLEICLKWSPCFEIILHSLNIMFLNDLFILTCIFLLNIALIAFLKEETVSVLIISYNSESLNQ